MAKKYDINTITSAVELAEISEAWDTGCISDCILEFLPVVDFLSAYNDYCADEFQQDPEPLEVLFENGPEYGIMFTEISDGENDAEPVALQLSYNIEAGAYYYYFGGNAYMPSANTKPDYIEPYPIGDAADDLRLCSGDEFTADAFDKYREVFPEGL